MADAWKINNREIVFKAGRNISKYLGDIAQNDVILTSLDLANEIAKADDLIKEVENYKQMIINNVEPVK